MNCKKIISVATATRAEYGLLRPLIAKLYSVEEFDVRLAVTGAHLSPEFGMTYKEIDEDGISIDDKIEILLSADTPSAISKSMGLAMIGFADYFERLKPDLLILLGDRYEILAIAAVAMNHRIPIAHIHGGETTEGAIDEVIRHAVTKMSFLHFTSTEEYRSRVIQLGESPDRVFNVGAIGVENALKINLLSKSELEEQLQWKLDRPYAVVTFHPVTLESEQAAEQMETVLEVLKEYRDMQFLLTMANADTSGRIINKMIHEFASQNDNSRVYPSLGTLKYLSAVKYSAMVIGNSSSGLIEVPSFRVPTINIGNRQKGRIQADSVINCESDYAQIKNALKMATDKTFIGRAKNVVNPYGNGNTCDKIVEIVKAFVLNDSVNLKKKFYDCVVK